MRFRADQRLFLSYLLLISFLVLALSIGAEILLRRHLLRTVRDDLVRELVLGRALLRARPAARLDSLAVELGRLSRRRVTLIAPDGRVVGESTPLSGGLAGMENHGDRPEVQQARTGRLAVEVRRSPTVGVDHLYAAAPGPEGLVIRFAVPLSEIDRAVGRVQRGILGIGAAALALAVAFSYLFSLAVGRPLRQIHSVALSMAGGDLSTRLRVRRDDELGDLARALNRLADELQQRLRQLEGERVEMQTLIDSMAEGVIALTPAGAVRRANPAARRMFSLPADFQGIPPEAVARRPEFLRLVQRARAGEAVPPTELGTDGRHLLATAHPLPDGGAVLVFLDVSELRRLEGMRRDFVANASHELKTPLTAIRGYSETLLDPELPPELRQRFAEVVRSNADRLQRIIDDLLDLSRIESGGWVVHPEPVDVAAAVQEAWSSLPPPPAEHRIHFVVETAPDAQRVRADAAALNQVFCNLFSNAVRYTAPGGRIEVRARRGSGARPRPAAMRDVGEVAGSPAPDWVEIEVRDTGAGIPAVHLPRIFERFYRVDPARSRAAGGTGLGLAIVKHLVEAHGGRVWAESQVRRGTAIRFTLPADPETG